MSRVIRNERARQLQGHRAGIVSRGIAFAIDIGVAFLVYLVIVAGVNVLWDVFFSSKISIPTPPGWLSALLVFWVLVVYLALGWGSTGRTIGKQLLGLRVVRADAGALRPGQAFGRAFLCALFYPGILLVVLDRRNRSLQDMACRTAVVYDWIPEAARPRRFPAKQGAAAATAPATSGEVPA